MESLRLAGLPGKGRNDSPKGVYYRDAIIWRGGDGQKVYSIPPAPYGV